MYVQRRGVLQMSNKGTYEGLHEIYEKTAEKARPKWTPWATNAARGKTEGTLCPRE